MAALAPVTKSKQKQNQKLKVVLKSVLCTPYNIQWPKVDKELNKDIIHHLSKVLVNHNLSKPQVKSSLRKEKRKTCMKQLLSERSDAEKNLKIQLVYGINEVTKSLERDNLQLVLVDRSAYTLTKHLIQLAGVRKCTGVALNDFTKTIAPLLGLTQLSCLGFHKLKEGDDKSFTDLVDFVNRNIPGIELPWLQFENALALSSEVEGSDDATKETLINESESKMEKESPTGKCEQANNSSFDDSKSEKERSLKLSFTQNICKVEKEKDNTSNKGHTELSGLGNNDFIAFNKESEDESDKEDKRSDLQCQPPQPKKRKLKCGDKKNERLQDDPFEGSQSKYQKMSLHKMQPNMNRKKSTKNKK